LVVYLLTMQKSLPIFLTLAGVWCTLMTGLQAETKPLGLQLPTDNQALFSGDPSDFYMYTYRTFEGVSSKPWTAGKYGFVRNQKRTAAGIVNTRFHEGADIRPVRRDSSGKPLDDVRAIADGKVVYVNSVSSRSSYGNYVVVEHDWGYGEFYSLYAHLMTTDVRSGQRVSAGTKLGRLGYTGVGINVERSHLHLELNMMLHNKFGRWHDKHFTSPNHHGNHNGLNLVGIDITGLYMRHKDNPNITIPEFMKGMEAHHKVIVPRRGELQLLTRYPFLGEGTGTPSTSWEITFSSSGIPMKIVPSSRSVSQPTVSWVKYSSTYHSYLTRGRLTGSGSSAGLSDSGLRYIQLIMGTF